MPDFQSSEKLAKASGIGLGLAHTLSSCSSLSSSMVHGIRHMIQHVGNGLLPVLGSDVHFGGNVEHVISVAVSSVWTEAGGRKSRSLSEPSHTRRCLIPLVQSWQLQHLALSCWKKEWFWLLLNSASKLQCPDVNRKDDGVCISSCSWWASHAQHREKASCSTSQLFAPRAGHVDKKSVC